MRTSSSEITLRVFFVQFDLCVQLRNYQRLHNCRPYLERPHKIHNAINFIKGVLWIVRSTPVVDNLKKVSSRRCLWIPSFLVMINNHHYTINRVWRVLDFSYVRSFYLFTLWQFILLHVRTILYSVRSDLRSEEPEKVQLKSTSYLSCVVHYQVTNS